MEQILELDNTDDIASIKGRIDYALPSLIIRSQETAGAGKPKPRRLLLIVPRKNKAMQSLVNMKLLARMLRNRAVELAVVSNNPIVRDHAKEAGVKVFGSFGNAKRFGWIKSKSPVTSPVETTPPVALPPVEGASSLADKPAEAQKTATGKKQQKKKCRDRM